MRVLVAFERSGAIRRELRALGHDAWSCDLLPARDSQEYHLQCDVLDLIDQPSRMLRHSWDAILAFGPDCTYLTNSAAWAYGDGPYHQRVKQGTLVGAERRAAREKAIETVMTIWKCSIKRKALENPIGILSSRFRKPDQIIQPHWFGDDASKATCIWIDGFPPLVATKHVAPRMVNGKPRWANQTDSGQNKLSPSDDRAELRAVTYPGIARALGEQWFGRSDPRTKSTLSTKPLAGNSPPKAKPLAASNNPPAGE